MANTGSLIQLHHHKYFDVLESLTDVDGNLYYKDAPIFTPISERNGNALSEVSDGLYVNGLTTLSSSQYNLLCKFSYLNGALFFDGVKVSQEYKENQIQVMITDLWTELDTLHSDPTDTPLEENNSGGETNDA